jgi:hypothetical protein
MVRLYCVLKITKDDGGKILCIKNVDSNNIEKIDLKGGEGNVFKSDQVFTRPSRRR